MNIKYIVVLLLSCSFLRCIANTLSYHGYDVHTIEIPFLDTRNISIETFDEKNNQITFYCSDTHQLYVYRIGSGIIKSFSLENVARYIANPNGKCAVFHYNDGTIDIIRDYANKYFCCSYSTELGLIGELNYENTDLIIGYDCVNLKPLNLLDLDTNIVTTYDAKRIEFDTSGRICMVVHPNKTTIVKRNDDTTRSVIRTFDTIQYARINRNGQQLATLHKNGSCSLVSINDAQEFPLPIFNKNPMFSIDGNYLATSFFESDSYTHTITHTSTGTPLLVFYSPASLFYLMSNYLVLSISSCGHNDVSIVEDAYLINLQQLQSLQVSKKIYSLEELVNNDIAIHFENACFSSKPYSWYSIRGIVDPNQQCVVTKDAQNTLRFIAINNKEVIFSLDNVVSYKFSKNGKMLFVSYTDKPCELFVFQF